VLAWKRACWLCSRDMVHRAPAWHRAPPRHPASLNLVAFGNGRGMGKVIVTVQAASWLVHAAAVLIPQRVQGPDNACVL